MPPQLPAAIAVAKKMISSGSLLRPANRFLSPSSPGRRSPLVRGRWFPAATSPQTPSWRLCSSTSADAGVAGSSEPPVFLAPGPDHRTELPPELLQESLPRHVAVIMDGNSRWAKARGLPSSAGHQEGTKAVMNTLRLSAAWGIRVLTVFVFSDENWLRPKAETDFVMGLLESMLRDQLEEFQRLGVRVLTIGDLSKLPLSTKTTVKETMELTKSNTALEFCLAVSYSGRNEIVKACQTIALKAKSGALRPEDITHSVIATELDTNCITEFPDPDLLIRTSGEVRLSNFLLWQVAYSELFFSNVLWPDFGESAYMEALLSFQQRQRRFGKRERQN